MTFYTYHYLTTQHSTWQYLRIALLIALLVAFMGLFFYYLRHRWNVKYKDLSIITGPYYYSFWDCKSTAWSPCDRLANKPVKSRELLLMSLSNCASALKS